MSKLVGKAKAKVRARKQLNNKTSMLFKGAGPLEGLRISLPMTQAEYRQIQREMEESKRDGTYSTSAAVPV